MLLKTALFIDANYLKIRQKHDNNNSSSHPPPSVVSFKYYFKILYPLTLNNNNKKIQALFKQNWCPTLQSLFEITNNITVILGYY